ncbi:aminotransferase class I/II-fold pyridoxal phosphate-dependent enzyme [Paremcibacter congregatus]|uniref:8-amino-7-oxononanoate synthase n=1 Tax=Paremcibacter congregatus TaxID=2043170 RepID=A0A2G4YPV3_9PROT|nr:aminotransferase class I/II-fold pyridoxal phosphate-dependent enzyme [Paremcibacter congregatus]PHZ84348.1 8-amino-7-oxononanoate synthase [Paremcibacter congregatus]QDE28568.1 8-amino-7-oxononanoate synthase [Paremcibacter congregatus]
MKSLDIFAADKLAPLVEQGLKREITVTDRWAAGQARRAGRPLLSFCCNDYLDFTHHPKVKQAAKDAIDRYGAGAGASRLITGNHPLIAELERRLAALKGTEDACLFSSGYLANIGIIPTLVSKDDVIFLDELSHACLRAGSSLAASTTYTFRHNDLNHLQELIFKNRKNHPRALIVTDGVFSMDGDLAPLDQLAQLARETDCWLMTDDAHGIGVIGAGRGSRHAFDPPPAIPLQMGTLSKGIGSFGGYLCASKPVIDLMKTRARSLIYTTALPPASVAAALAALDIIETDPVYCQRPLQNAKHFTDSLGLPAPESPIVPIIIGPTDKTMRHAKSLEENGFLVTGIRPPTVSVGTARLRFTFSAAHKEREINALTDSIRRLGIV